MRRFASHDARKIGDTGAAVQDPGIIVVGVGALGSEICRQLARRSYSRVLLIDPDRLEQRNKPLSLIYQRASLISSSDLFEDLKVKLVLAAVMSDFSLSWEAAPVEIGDLGLGRLKEYDIILSCTDNALARIETTRAARVLGLPMIDAGVMGGGFLEGRAAYFSPAHDAACYLCGLTEARRAQLLVYASAISLGCNAPAVAPSMDGTLDTTCQTAGAVMELLREWQQNGDSTQTSFARRVWPERSASWSSEQILLSRSVSCPWHGDQGQWSTVNEDRPIREAIDHYDMRLQLLWSQCLEARCRGCGHHDKPFRRVAWVRRTMRCGICGKSGVMEPVRAIESIGATEPEAELTSRQLGLPNRHLYLLRSAFVPARGKDIDEPVA